MRDVQNGGKSRKLERERERERAHQRGWTPDDTALVVVLGAMAGADELVLCSVPWDNTSKMSAHSIYSVSGKRPVGLHY